MSSDPGRGVWLPEFELTKVLTIGEDWPEAVIVTKWERNLVGERRLVGSRSYVSSVTHDELVDEAVQALEEREAIWKEHGIAQQQ